MNAKETLATPSKRALSFEAAKSFFLALWGIAAVTLAILYTAVLGIFAAAAAACGGEVLVSYIAKLWSIMILRTCGIRVELEGQEHLRGLDSFVLVANHQSVLDIFALLAALPYHLRFVAKKELRRIPLVGYAMERSGHIMVDRERGGTAVRHAIRMAQRGYPIVFFAEGHRYADNKVHPFNEGAAWLAILGKLPCVPTALCGSGELYPPRAKIVRPYGTIRIKLCQPIATAGLTAEDRESLTRKLEATVSEAFHDLLTRHGSNA